MSKIVTIPYGMNPFVVLFNGDYYTYTPGETVEVPDGVAVEIEEYKDFLRKRPPAPQAPFNPVAGADGVGVQSIMQTHKCTKDEGNNIITVTMTDGAKYTFKVQNGSKGSTGDKGDPGEKGEPGDVSTEQLDAAIGEVNRSITLLGDDVTANADDIKAIKGQIADILYNPITITSLENDVKTAELGSVVNKVKVSWKTNKTATVLELDGEDVTGSEFYQFLNQGIMTNKTFTLKATDERGAVATKTTSINFYNRIRYGAAADYTELALSDGVLSDTKKRDFTVTAGAGQYIWYILPKRLGTCSFKVGGFDGGFTLLKTEQLTNASGYTEEYYIYRSDNAALGETAVTVA